MLSTRFVRRVGNVYRVTHNIANMSPTMVITKDDAVLPIDSRLTTDLRDPLPFDSGLFSMSVCVMKRCLFRMSFGAHGSDAAVLLDRCGSGEQKV